ncbi:MAG: flagellar hook-basal body complex protein [Terracidiphilus sp.]|nr:flagellar hook-basal body complex protein [Terracidiphilus sp.]
MPSFYIPLSGLNADSTALNTIANNLSNMNTTAYKAQTTNFSDLLYQQIGTTGSGDEIQVGGGVKVASNSVDYTQGSFSTSGTTSSDVALNGNGFFLVSDGSTNLLTRNGAFTQDTNGNLVTSNGLSVMGYPAVDGVVNTSSALTAINIPVIGDTQAPKATTTFGMTATLDSSAKVGTSVPGQIEVYDSLGAKYEATVTYTKTGTNQWSYSISLPDTTTAAPATAAAAATLGVTSTAGAATMETIAAAGSTPSATTFTSTLTPTSTVSGTDTLYNYNFGTGGTADGTSTLTIGGTAVPVTTGDTPATLLATINGLGIAGVSASVTGNVLTITSPTATALSGSLVGDLSGTSSAIQFNTGGTVDPATNMTISGLKADGSSATITAPTVTSGETISQYASALTTALATAGITNVTVAANTTTNQVSIVGADVSTAGAVKQNLAAATTHYDFGATATVDPTSNLTITGQTAAGVNATITAPTITAGETVAQYVTALNTAIGNAGIVGVTASSTGGQLSIVGANTTLAGNVSQDLTATTISYNFGTSGGTVATVDPSTSLTITGQTTTGATATITAPTVTSGETVAQYAAALTTALATAGITGVSVSSTAGGQLSIVGANITSSGSVVQEPVASANATGTMTFDSSGNLVSPAADVTGITFAGLSDGAATMNMTWNILGTSGTPTITQVSTSSSSTSAGTQNGYASGAYQSFAIGTDGTVTASYSNGQTQSVGQLALANVTNTSGLTLLGNSNYETTLASGAASIGVSGTNGLATIQDSTLEMSNVSISAEFSNLIIAQRAFEANSKAITTFDTVTQQAINMIH